MIIEIFGILAVSAIVLGIFIFIEREMPRPPKEDKWPEIKGQDCGKCPYKMEIKR